MPRDDWDRRHLAGRHRSPAKASKSAVPNVTERDEAGFIQPGHPWEIGRVEGFFDKPRDELPNRQQFCAGSEIQCSLASMRSTGMKSTRAEVSRGSPLRTSKT